MCGGNGSETDKYESGVFGHSLLSKAAVFSRVEISTSFDPTRSLRNYSYMGACFSYTRGFPFWPPG